MNALPYKRDTGSRPILIRLYFIVAAGVMIHAFSTGMTNLGYFLAVVLLACLPVTMTSLYIDKDICRIKKYYFFGLIPVKWIIQRDRIVGVGYYTADYETDYIPEDNGPWWDIILIFLPPKITTKHCKIEYFDEQGILKKFRIGLTFKEYKLIVPEETDSFPDKQPVA